MKPSIDEVSKLGAALAATEAVLAASAKIADGSLSRAEAAETAQEVEKLWPALDSAARAVLRDPMLMLSFS